ncbi:MAG: hypothetical protein A3K10_13605 [Bacteroidetes bacterium RIFCSPLOWO2_12_FULL_31_6]|nr:MAG: hypothetical protein A3K10_13605 [Bacteroidetes bacterium RIFCSPLOWO2_12_FULL_31_6]
MTKEPISKNQLLNVSNHYIITKQRSGSTLLGLILGNSIDSQVIHEENIYYKFKEKYNLRIFDNITVVDEFITEFFSYSTHAGVSNQLPNKEKLKVLLTPYLEYQLNFKHFCNLFYQFFFSAQETKKITTIVNKDIIYHVSVEEIHRDSPNSKFVFLIRDSVSNINSCINANFGSSNVVGQTYVWNNLMEDIVYSTTKLPCDNFIIVKFEELIKDTHATVSLICNFLGIPFHVSMLNNQNAAKKIYDYAKERYRERNNTGAVPKENIIHSSSRGEIDKDKLTKNNFSDNEIKKIIYLTNKFRKKFDYTSNSRNWKHIFLLTPIDLFAYLKIRIQLGIVKYYFHSNFYRKVFFRRINIFNLFNSRIKIKTT